MEENATKASHNTNNSLGREELNALLQGIDNNLPLKELSKRYCALVLARHDNNKVHASRTLGVDRRSLQRWKLGA